MIDYIIYGLAWVGAGFIALVAWSAVSGRLWDNNDDEDYFFMNTELMIVGGVVAGVVFLTLFARWNRREGTRAGVEAGIEAGRLLAKMEGNQLDAAEQIGRLEAYKDLVGGTTVKEIADKIGASYDKVYRDLKQTHYSLGDFIWALKYMREDKEMFIDLANARIEELSNVGV